MDYSIINEYNHSEKCVCCGSMSKICPQKLCDVERKFELLRENNLNRELERNLVAQRLYHVSTLQRNILSTKLEHLLYQRENIRNKIIGIKGLIVDRSQYLYQLRAKNQVLADEHKMINSCSRYMEEKIRKDKKTLEKRRWKEVSDVFCMIPIVPTFPKMKSEITDCSTILSIPLLNSGDYSGTPPEIVSAGLGYIAHVVETLAAVLNIPLPHPIMPFGAFDYAVICPQGRLDSYLPLCPYLLGSLMHSRQPPWVVTRRCPQLEELEAEGWVFNEVFQEALELLRANVICLCFKLQVPPKSMWPAECLLLNLFQIQLMAATHCDQTRSRAPRYAAPLDPDSLDTSLRSLLVGRYNRPVSHAWQSGEYSNEAQSSGRRDDDWDLCDDDTVALEKRTT